MIAFANLFAVAHLLLSTLLMAFGHSDYGLFLMGLALWWSLLGAEERIVMEIKTRD